MKINNIFALRILTHHKHNKNNLMFKFKTQFKGNFIIKSIRNYKVIKNPYKSLKITYNIYNMNYWHLPSTRKFLSKKLMRAKAK